MSITYIHTLAYSATFDSESYMITASHTAYGVIACLHLDGVTFEAPPCPSASPSPTRGA